MHIAGFTPSDAAHTLGKQTNWHAGAARLGAELFARKRDGKGQPIASDPEALAERVLSTLTRFSAEVILETAFAEDGLDGAATVAHALVQRAVDGTHGIARLTVALDRPVVGLGASAPLHYAALPPLVGNRCLVPEDTDVANALGAVVGQVRVTAEAQISQPKEGLFRMSAGDTVSDFTERRSRDCGSRGRRPRNGASRAKAAGTDTAEIELNARLLIRRLSRGSVPSSKRMSWPSPPDAPASPCDDTKTYPLLDNRFVRRTNCPSEITMIDPLDAACQRPGKNFCVQVEFWRRGG